jgi:hypothetical protein
MFTSKKFSFSDVESMLDLFNAELGPPIFCEVLLETLRLDVVSAKEVSVWTLEPEKSVWKSKLMHHSIEEVSLPQGTFLQVFASGDVLQELDVVATMCARSCMLHPSLQFIAELEVINFPPAINVISSGKRMSTHDKLVSRYGSEFDYVVEDGSTVTHVLVNSKNLKMMAVAELYIAINGVMKTLPQVLASRLMTKPWPIENSEPLIMRKGDNV